MSDARPVGRPPLAEDTQRISAILTAADVAYLDRIDSNRSAAIRTLIQEHNQMTIDSITIQAIDTKPQYDPMTNISGMATYTEFWLDCRDRTCGVSQEMRDNSTPMAVYHGHIRTCRIDGHPSETDIRRDLDDNGDLLARIVTGYESVWNGNNHVATYTPDAEAAWEDLCNILQSNQNHYEFWQTDEWLYPAMETDIHADTSDEQIRQLAEDWMQTDDHIILDAALDWAIRYITEYRDEQRADAE